MGTMGARVERGYLVEDGSICAFGAAAGAVVIGVGLSATIARK
jgi:hypothetical protein